MEFLKVARGRLVEKKLVLFSLLLLFNANWSRFAPFIPRFSGNTSFSFMADLFIWLCVSSGHREASLFATLSERSAGYLAWNRRDVCGNSTERGVPRCQ